MEQDLYRSTELPNLPQSRGLKGVGVVAREKLARHVPLKQACTQQDFFLCTYKKVICQTGPACREEHVLDRREAG